MKVRYRARALADLDDIFRFLDERSPTGARNVMRAIHDAIEEVVEHPLASQRTSDSDIRVKVLGRYRYKIFFGIDPAGVVEIIHIRHTARRPWR